MENANLRSSNQLGWRWAKQQTTGKAFYDCHLCLLQQLRKNALYNRNRKKGEQLKQRTCTNKPTPTFTPLSTPTSTHSTRTHEGSNLPKPTHCRDTHFVHSPPPQLTNITTAKLRHSRYRTTRPPARTQLNSNHARWVVTLYYPISFLSRHGRKRAASLARLTLGYVERDKPALLAPNPTCSLQALL